MPLNMKKVFGFQYRCMYTNVLIEPNQDHSKITKELFKDPDDITVIKNRMQELRNSLEEQSTSLVSSLNCGDNELSRNSAKDCWSNLQKYFKMQSALITLCETQVKELKIKELIIVALLRPPCFIHFLPGASFSPSSPSTPARSLNLHLICI